MDAVFGLDLDSNSQTREQIRRPLRKSARLMLDNQRSFDVQTIDISLNGICVMVEAPIPIGHSCSVSVDVFFKDKPRKIILEGKVIYCLLKGMDGFRTGILATQLNQEGIQYINTFFQ